MCIGTPSKIELCNKGNCGMFIFQMQSFLDRAGFDEGAPKGTNKFPSFQAFIHRSNMLGLVDKVKGFFAVLAIFGQDVRASRRKTLITIIVCALGCTALSAFVLKRLQQKQIQSTPSSRSLKGTNNTKFTSQIKGMKITISTLGV